MANLTHIFRIGQTVKVKLDGKLYIGTVTQTDTNHIIVNIDGMNLWFENGFNIDKVYPAYN